MKTDIFDIKNRVKIIMDKINKIEDNIINKNDPTYKNTKRKIKSFEKNKFIIIPNVYRYYTEQNSNIIIMDWREGETINKLRMTLLISNFIVSSGLSRWGKISLILINISILLIHLGVYIWLTT